MIRSYVGIVLFCWIVPVACDSSKKACIEEPIIELAIDTVSYSEFVPNSSDFSSELKVNVHFAHQLDSLTIVTGLDPYVDYGMFIDEDTINGWGHRLYVFNEDKEMVYKSKGTGENYLFKPHFYRNDANDKIIIVCRVAMEYDLGGEVFLLENGEVSYLGGIPFSGPDMETNLIDILKVDQVEEELIFTFTSDSVFHSSPDVAEEIISSKGLSCRYKNGRFHVQK